MPTAKQKYTLLDGGLPENVSLTNFFLDNTRQCIVIGPLLDYGLKGGTPKDLKGLPQFLLSCLYVCLSAYKFVLCTSNVFSNASW